jgi:hypothetical protein
MSNKSPNKIVSFILSLDKYINFTYQDKAHVYGWITGVFIYIAFILMFFSGGIVIKNENIKYILFASFPITYFFVKMNFYLWSNARVADHRAKNLDVRDCGCRRNALPNYGNSGWLKARLSEHYTCVVYKFIAGILLGWCLGAVLFMASILIFN